MNQPLDAKFEEVAPGAKVRWIWILLGLMVGLLPGLAAILFFVFARQASLPPEYASDLNDLRLQIRRLEEKINNPSNATDLGTIENRLKILESAPLDNADLIDRINEWEKSRLMDQAEQKNWNDRINSQLTEMTTKLEELNREEQERPVPEYLALGMVLLNWRWALETGQPFQSILEQIRYFDPVDNEKLISLMEKSAPFSHTGAPSLVRLQKEFPARAIAAALEAEKISVEGQDWLNRISGELAKIIVIRRKEPTNSHTDLDRLALAEKYVGEGNLVAAIQEMASFPDPASPWIEKAKHRLIANEIEAEINLLLAELIDE